jgi:hypothetical protein
MDKMEKMK